MDSSNAGASITKKRKLSRNLNERDRIAAHRPRHMPSPTSQRKSPALSRATLRALAPAPTPARAAQATPRNLPFELQEQPLPRPPNVNWHGQDYRYSNYITSTVPVSPHWFSRPVRAPAPPSTSTFTNQPYALPPQFHPPLDYYDLNPVIQGISPAFQGFSPVSQGFSPVSQGFSPASQSFPTPRPGLQNSPSDPWSTGTNSGSNFFSNYQDIPHAVDNTRPGYPAYGPAHVEREYLPRAAQQQNLSSNNIDNSVIQIYNQIQPAQDTWPQHTQNNRQTVSGPYCASQEPDIPLRSCCGEFLWARPASGTSPIQTVILAESFAIENALNAHKLGTTGKENTPKETFDWTEATWIEAEGVTTALFTEEDPTLTRDFDPWKDFWKINFPASDPLNQLVGNHPSPLSDQ